ncbi:MAG TPA: RHS repeat-associated core domain-containing protein, partial [Pyrinomonadaceae bacterium]
VQERGHVLAAVVDGGVRLPALVSFASETEVRVTVPNGAATGVIRLTNAWGAASTAEPFTVEAQQDFQITVAPATASAVQRASATYVVSLTSAQPSFTQLARLTASGLPEGVRVAFDPPQLTAGASSTLTLNLSDVNLPAGSYPFTIKAAADVEGRETVRAASATLNVLPAGRTTLSGRVLNTDSEPIIGAIVSLDGKTATTDASGSFLLSDITAGQNRPVTIDGRTASSPNRSYPLITEPANVVAGQANVVPFIFYLPPIDVQFEVELVPGQNTVAGNPRVPGLQMIVPAGANLRNRDGSPVARISITPLAIDRTPTPLPTNVSTNVVYTSQPGGALTDIAIPVVYPNLAGANPGTRIELYAFNHDTVDWYRYGFGRVTADGRSIAPEIDPATGRSYGLIDFSWHFPNAGPGGNPGGGGGGCPSSAGPNPVDFSTGMKMETTTDISFIGARGGLALTRVYTSDMAQACDFCPFGRGATHNYAVRLSGSFGAGGAGRVVMPKEGTGRLFSYARTDPDGALVFATTATVDQLGDTLRKLTNGTYEYREALGGVMRFDSAGRLTSLSDRNGNATTLAYSGSNLTQITDAVGRSITLAYDSSNRIVRATDPVNRAWRYTYEGTPGVAGGPGLTTVTDPAGNVTRYAYVVGGRLASVTDPRGNVAKRLTYDGSGRVVEQKFADGTAERYAYTLAGGLVTTTTITDPLGRSHTRRFNAAGYVTEMRDAAGQSSRIARDITTNLPSTTTGSCGCPESEQQYDARGNMTALIDQAGATDRYEYEPVFNNVTKMTDKLGRVTTFAYDGRGNLTSVTDALGQTTSYAYDQFGQLTSVTDPLGHATHMEYAADGSLREIRDALGHRTLMESDGLGRLVATVDPLGRRSSMAYDPVGRVTSMTDSNGAVTAYSYDANGNKVKSKDATGQEWTMTYDARNRQVSNKDPLGRVTRMRFDANDQLTQVTTPSGRSTRYAYDGRGQVSEITDPLNGVVKLTYDTKQQITSLADQRGHVVTFTYDELSRPTGRRDPLGQSTRVSYDAVGNIVEKTDRLGRQTTVSYDPLNRPVRVAYPDAVVTYAFDAAGRPTRVSDSQSGDVVMTFDDAGHLLSEATPAGTMTYAYNDAGQRTEMRAADREPVSYEYDTAGRLRHIKRGGQTFTYGYDALSRRSSLSRPNGIITSYVYDAVNRLSRLTHSGGSAPEDYRYGYNDDDELTAVTSNFGAPLLPQPKQASAADPLNRVAQVGGVGYTFNAEGQTTSRTDARGTELYQWDARGRVTGATLADGRTVNYAYDALGRRASRTAGGVTTNFLYDGDDVVLDRNGDGTTVEYLNGLETDEKLQQASAATGPLYFIQDHLDSVVALTDASGGVVERMQYEAFGESAGSSLTRYGYTGRERDPLTGLLYYRARWYDPNQGRFISEDPIGYDGGGANFYAYVNNDPVNFNDPLGMQGKRGGGGGPYHPPAGVSLRCTNADSCSALQGKMMILMRMINSHQGWDRHVPKPRGGNRHAGEIADLWRAYANCQAIYARKCPPRNPRSCPLPQPAPAPA